MTEPPVPLPPVPDLPAPPPAPAPAVPEVYGIGAHIEQWLAWHLGPDIEALKRDLADERIKGGNALAAIRKAAPVLEKAARVLEASVRAGTLPAEIIADAEAVLAEAGTVAGDLAAFGL